MKRKLFTFWVALLAMCGLSVKAGYYEVGQTFTNLDDLVSNGTLFSIVNEAEGKALCFGINDEQNMNYATYSEAYALSRSYTFKLEAAQGDGVTGYYYLRPYKPDGTLNNVWGWGGYFNSQAADQWCCFCLGVGDKNGQDIKNGAVWALVENEGKFALKNIGTGKYLKDSAPAKYDDPTYFTLCTLNSLPKPDAPLVSGELIPDFFSICEANKIPYGYNVKFGSEYRDYPNGYGSGPRMFDFATGGDFTKGFYFREGYVQYGIAETLSLEANKTYTVYFNSAMWKSSGDQITFQIFKANDLNTAVLTKTVTNTLNLNGSTGAVSGSKHSEFEFTPEAEGKYVLRWSVDGFKEVILASVGMREGNAALDVSAYDAMKAQVLALDDDATVYTGSATIDISAAEAAIAAATTEADVTAACNLLREAAITFVTSVTVNENKAFDMTPFFLVNPDFEVPTANGQMPPGWTITIGGANCGQQNRTDRNEDTGLEIRNFIEAWHWSALTPGVIAQTVTTLPEGTYRLECDASVCHDPASGDGTDIKGANLFIKSSIKTERTAVGNVRLGIKHYAVSFSHGGTGEVQFGLEATSEINANWLSADNFKVYYAGGVDLSVYATALAEAVADFEALESSVDAIVFASLKAQVDALNTTYTTSSDYQAAINNVKIITAYTTAYAAATATLTNSTYANITGSEKTSLTEAIADAPTYDDYTTYEAKTIALNNATSNFTAVVAAYDTYVTYKAETMAAFGTDFSVAAPTSAAECATAVQNLNIAQYNKVATDYTFSCSGLIGDFGSWTGTATVAGAAATPNYLDYEHWSGEIHAYYEQASNGWGNAGGWTIQYQKTCTLPAGEYVIKVAARSSGGTTSTVSCTATTVTVSLPNVGSSGRGIATNGVASWSDADTFVIGNNNDTDPAVGGQGLGWQWRFLPFTLTNQTEVTMTFYAEASTQYQWMSIADGELLSKTKLAEDITYDEANSNTIENKLIADVTMTRNIKVGYNTVVLPFTATANQVATAFGTGTEVYAFSENSDDAKDATINFNKNDGSITANTPVLIKATKASASQTFNGVQVIAATEAKVAGKNFDFVGTYAPITTIPAGDYFIGGGKIYKSAGATSLNAFRAYIQNKNGGAIKSLNIFDEEGNATAIDATEIEGLTVGGKIFDLSGREVKTPVRGLYIQNGKKVFIK